MPKDLINLRKVLLSFFVLLICLNTFSQQYIKGFVVDATTNLPLDGVTISLLPINKSITTDVRGQFVFTNLNKVVSITVSSIGYETKSIPISSLSNNGVISLQQQKTQLMRDSCSRVYAGARVCCCCF